MSVLLEVGTAHSGCLMDGCREFCVDLCLQPAYSWPASAKEVTDAAGTSQLWPGASASDRDCAAPVWACSAEELSPCWAWMLPSHMPLRADPTCRTSIKRCFWCYWASKLWLDYAEKMACQWLGNLPCWGQSCVEWSQEET